MATRTIAVIDGLGGGIGAQIVTQLRQALPLDIEILAMGANAIATDKMIRANAIRVSVGLADFIVAPIGVVIPNSMMGEITPAIAQAVAEARGYHSTGGAEPKRLTSRALRDITVPPA